MPHVIVQASRNVTIKHPQRLLKSLNNSLWQSGHFEQPEDIKARIVDIETFLVGVDDDGQAHGFVFVQLKLMPGRSETIKHELAANLLDTLNNELAANISSRVSVQLCAEVVELSPSYHKRLLGTA